MHVHTGILEFLKIGAMVTIWAFFWRIISAHNHSNAIGQGMSFIL